MPMMLPMDHSFKLGKWPLTPEPVRQLPSLGVSRAQMAAIVRKAQAALMAKGYGRCAVTGTIDRDTKEALWVFQFAHRLPQTGHLDTETVRLLGD